MVAKGDWDKSRPPKSCGHDACNCSDHSSPSPKPGEPCIHCGNSQAAHPVAVEVRKQGNVRTLRCSEYAPADPPPLHWYCWIHDTPEQCETTDTACDFGYWLCPECKIGMECDDEARPAYGSVWRCPDCETSIDLATLRPA